MENAAIPVKETPPGTLAEVAGRGIIQHSRYLEQKVGESHGSTRMRRSSATSKGFQAPACLAFEYVHITKPRRPRPMPNLGVTPTAEQGDWLRLSVRTIV